MKKKTARKTHRKPAKRRARKDNPTKKRAHTRRPAKRRARRRNPTHVTKKQVRRSPVGYSIHKKHPHKRRRAARKDNPVKRRRARRSHARRDNPTTHRRRRHHTSKRRTHHYGRRRNNPSHGISTMGAMDVVTLGLSFVGGLIIADAADRWWATRQGAKSTAPFYGASAIAEISAPPDSGRMLVQGVLAVLGVVGGGYLWKKGYKKSAEIAAGIGVGAGAHAVLQLWNDKVIPSIAKVADPKELTWKNRLYPDLQADSLAAMAKTAADIRANATSGVQAPRVPQAPARGPQGAPRVAPTAQRPAPSNAAGCGMDGAYLQQIAAMKAENERLQALIAANATGNAAGATVTNIASKKTAFA